MLALIHAASGGANFDCDYTDDEDDDDEEDGSDEDGARAARGFHASSSINSLCGPVIEVGAHPEMKLVRQIGEESSSGGFGGVEMWDATVATLEGEPRVDRSRGRNRRIVIGRSLKNKTWRKI